MISAVGSAGAVDSTCGSGAATDAARRWAGHVSRRAKSASSTSVCDSPANQASHSAGRPAAVRPRIGIAFSPGEKAVRCQSATPAGAAASI